MTKKKTSADFDAAWKEVVEVMFEPFLEFLFPQIHKDIDFSKKYEFLNKELRKISPDSKTGKRFADVLVKVHLKDSEKPAVLLIHIEIQGYKDPGFMERMFIYYYRIFDRFHEEGLEVISLGVFTDEDENFRPEEYLRDRSGWNFELRMKIPVVKILDYRVKEEKRNELTNSKNPMALVVRVQLKSFEAQKADVNQRYEFKRDLIRECYKEGYTKKQIHFLLRFIDLIIRLPEDIEKRLLYEIAKFEEDKKMDYVTSWEQIAKKEGKKEGIKEGIKEGKKEGKKRGIQIGEKKGIQIGEKKGKLKTAAAMIQKGLNLDLIAEVTGFSKQQVQKLAASGQ